MESLYNTCRHQEETRHIFLEEECSNVVETIPIFENIEVNLDGPMHKQPRVENMYLSTEQAIVVILVYWHLGKKKLKV